MGEVELSRGATSIRLSRDLSVQRRAGRPGSRLTPLPSEDIPRYDDVLGPAWDSFEFGATLTGNQAEADARTLVEDILREPLGSGTLTLTFRNDLFGLSSYEVVPVGGQSGRASWSRGESGVTRVDNLELRVVGEP